MTPQQQRTLDYLKQNKTITRLQGWSKVGVLELPARICELRDMGYQIETKMVTIKNRFGERVRVARWTLVSERRAA